MSIFRILKTVFTGYLLLTAGAFAQKDLCRQGNTRHLCEGNLGIPRGEMPQVVDQVRADYLANVGAGYARIPAHQLTATQGEVNGKIVYGMLQAHAKGEFSPCDREILVAHNGTHSNIIDGHHTASACRLLGGKQFAAIVCGFADRILTGLKTFPGVFRLHLDDSRK